MPVSIFSISWDVWRVSSALLAQYGVLKMKICSKSAILKCAPRCPKYAKKWRNSSISWISWFWKWRFHVNSHTYIVIILYHTIHSACVQWLMHKWKKSFETLDTNHWMLETKYQYFASWKHFRRNVSKITCKIFSTWWKCFFTR